MRFLFSLVFVFVLLLTNVRSNAQTLVPDSVQQDKIFKELGQYFSYCAHGHSCCEARCPCCGELHRGQVYDTFVSPEVRGIKRYTIIERYLLALSNEKAPVQYLFKNAAGEITASYFGKWVTQNDMEDIPEWKTKLRNDPDKGFRNGVALVHDGNFDYTLIDETGTEQRIAFQSSSYFSKGLRKVSLIINGERIFGLADAQGNKRSPLKYAVIEPLHNGFAKVSISKYGSFGFIDSNGKEVVPCIYYHIGSFVNEVCVVARADSGATLIDRNGKQLWKYRYNSIEEVSEGLYPVRKDKLWGFMDVHENIVVPFIYERVFRFSDGLAAVCDNKKWGFVDHSGEVIIPLIYERVLGFGDERAPVVGSKAYGGNGLWGVIDKTGKMVVTPVYDEIYPYKEGFAKARINGEGFGYINRKGTVTIPLRYGIENYSNDSSWFPYERIVLQDKDRRYFLADKKGRKVLDLPEYEEVRLLPSSRQYITRPTLLRVRSKVDHKYGLIDLKGKLIIPCIYDMMQLDSDSLLLVCVDKNCGFISITGEVVLAPQPAGFYSRFEDGLVQVQMNEERFYIDKDNKRIMELY